MADLFSILCTTCKTKLRVRDPGVVGHILACPKCSSMVLVEAPPGWAPPLPGEVPSASPTGSAVSNGHGSGQQESTILKKPAATPTSSTPAKPTLPTVKALPASPAAASPAASLPVASSSRAKRDPADPASMKETASASQFAEVESLFGGNATKPAAAAGIAQAVKPKPKAAEGSGEKRRNTPVPPPPAELNATPPGATIAPKPDIDPVPMRTKRVRMIALLTIGGLMGISLAISAAYFAATWASNSREVAEAPTDVPAEEPAVVEPGPEPEPEPKESDSSDPSSSEPPVEPIEERPAPPEPPEAPNTETPGTETPGEGKTPRDPLDIVNDKPREDDPSDIAKLKDAFKGLENDAGPTPAEAETTEEPSTETPAPPDVPAAPPSRSRPEPREIDMAARLADPIVEIEFTGQKLSDVLQFLSNFSTIPITLDADALALPWSNITPAAPINAKLSNATFEEVLIAVLKPLRLEARKLDDQIVVTRSAAIKKAKSPVDDLTGGDAAQTKQLIETITLLAAPQSWKSAGGVGNISAQGNDLVIENTELAYAEVLHVCERLRQARGLRPKGATSAELFPLERRTARAAAKLDQPLTLNFGQPTLLVRILDRLAEETGTHIVVDWQAAGEIGWPPDCDATVTLDKTPLREALVKLLTPMDLTFRVIDAQTLQVTTPAALESKYEIEAYAAEDLAATPQQAKDLLERIAAALGDAPLHWDAPSKTLLARLPQPQHERLAALLAQWREEGAK